MVLNFVNFELSDGDDSLFESQECTSIADFAINPLPVMIRSNDQTSNMRNLIREYVCNLNSELSLHF
jgi:hypothetical protein